MKFKAYFMQALCISVVLFQLCCAQNLDISTSKLEQIKREFKNISSIILKLGQTKIPNPYAKDIDTINQILNSREMSQKSIESILKKLSKIKSSLAELDPKTNISIQKIPGKYTEQPLKNFLATTYKKFSSDIKLMLENNQKLSNPINDKDLTTLKNSFRPIFFGFYDLFKHPYYKYLEIIRRTLYLGADKEKLALMRDIMELILSDLNDENQNQIMTVETSAYQKFNLSIRDFKELIKKFINNLNSLIK